MLAERIAPAPRLVPEEPRERALVFGYGFEICGELGFGWARRLMMFDRMLPPGDDPLAGVGPVQTLARRYGYSRDAARSARDRCARTLAGLPVLAPPVTGNLGRGRATGGLVLFELDGHFPVFDNPDAITQWTGFIDTLAHARVPTIPSR